MAVVQLCEVTVDTATGVGRSGRAWGGGTGEDAARMGVRAVCGVVAPCLESLKALDVKLFAKLMRSLCVLDFALGGEVRQRAAGAREARIGGAEGGGRDVDEAVAEMGQVVVSFGERLSLREMELLRDRLGADEAALVESLWVAGGTR